MLCFVVKMAKQKFNLTQQRLLGRRQEILQQVVQRRKLLSQHLCLHKTLCHEHVLHDQLPVWHHYSDGTEQGLQCHHTLSKQQAEHGALTVMHCGVSWQQTGLLLIKVA